MVRNLVHNLYNSLVTDIGAVSEMGGKASPHTPITYLTQWKIVGNSEVHGNEIWSCGEYNATDGKYHILVKPQGGSIADIALDEPLRKVNDVADTIEFPSDIEGKTLVTRNFSSILIRNASLYYSTTNITGVSRKLFSGIVTKPTTFNSNVPNILCSSFETKSASDTFLRNKGISADVKGNIQIYDPDYNTTSDINDFKTAYADTEVIYELVTPTTELVDAPQIAEADSYTCVISQGGKAVSWSDFITDKEELYAYGVQWNKEVENPDVTRIGNMELHKADKLPVQNAMRGCLLNDNGDVVQYLSDSDWQNASLLDGSHGQVMIEIPTFYWKFSEDENGIQSVMLSIVEIEGYKKVNKMYVSAYEATVDRGNAEGTGATSTWKLASVKSNSPRFRGGNNDSTKDSAYNTQLKTCATNISLTNFRTYARRRKANSTEWNCNTYLAQKVIYWLYVVEFATRNSQKAVNANLTTEGYRQGGLGSGVTNANGTNWNNIFLYYPFTPIGTSDNLGNGTGETSYASIGSDGETVWCTTNVNRYRGIENPFGHTWKITDGVHVQVESGDDGKSKVYVSYNPADFNDSGNTGYTYIGDEMRTNGTWIKEVLFGDGGDILCKTEGGSASQYFTDKHYCSIPASGSALRNILFGGNSLCDSLAGLVFSSSNYSPASVSASIGSRLTFIPSTD